MAFAKPKASSSARGYGYAHQQERKRRVALHTPASPCSNCGRPLGPYYGTSRRGRRIVRWHLPHLPDRSGYYPGLWCWDCNVPDGSRKGALVTNARRKAGVSRPVERTTSRVWRPVP